MIKIFITILAVYLLYYAGNILYDLFLKKDTVLKDEEGEEFALAAFAEINTNEITEVNIDDVEHLNTPTSFHKKEPFPSTEEDTDENRHLDYYRQKFESEQAIDMLEDTYNIDEHPTTQHDSTDQEDSQYIESREFSEVPSQNDEILQAEQNKEDASQRLKQQFNQFLNLAETHVQVLADRDGFKVYHSMI
ncbi:MULTISPECIES: hypothetical protein [Chryseobacterium]|uniref:Conjugal transfer protein n=1 Tax=Chryseobacterium profundimaris TaxID=1387275 RepID=A0ABY1NYW8_9FLAO|nr:MULTISPECIES: hypothetical protein [Chryseobacterium]PZU89041.1 MAG: hypothetical protein DI529_04890 [Chryseobacterium sp.]SMP22328.1 hypothetical protein SAMN06264346_106160 [Chryseobacterium profundimaris]